MGTDGTLKPNLRSLKREVRLHALDAQSAAMVAKELVLGVAACNLTRAAMKRQPQPST